MREETERHRVVFESGELMLVVLRDHEERWRLPNVLTFSRRVLPSKERPPSPFFFADLSV